MVSSATRSVPRAKDSSMIASFKPLGYRSDEIVVEFPLSITVTPLSFSTFVMFDMSLRMSVLCKRRNELINGVSMKKQKNDVDQEHAGGARVISVP